MKRLPFDVERCHGVCCIFPEKCARYNQRDNVGPRTPCQHGYTGKKIQREMRDCGRFIEDDET
jgi:hypothetical protein